MPSVNIYNDITNVFHPKPFQARPSYLPEDRGEGAGWWEDSPQLGSALHYSALRYCIGQCSKYCAVILM